MQDPTTETSPDTSSADSPIAPHATPEKKKSHLPSFLGLMIFLALFVGGGAAFTFHVMGKIPTATWRDCGTELPWETEFFTIEKIDSQWLSSQNNERMALRVACYPEAHIVISDIKKSGVLMVSFLDENHQRIGDILSLPFSTAGFKKINDDNIQVKGHEVTLYPFAGIKSLAEYLVHQVDYHGALWNVKIQYKIDGDTRIHDLHEACIPPNILAKGKKQ